MNRNPHNPFFPGSGSAEESLKLIAGLPAPAGLEDRVHAALRAAPRSGRLLAWPNALHPRMSLESGWMRTAAAAAIVFVVVGGGWGVYTRVRQGQPDKVIVMPSRMPASGGFSGAGAIRTPQILPGPTVIRPAKPHPAQLKGTKKPSAHPAPTAKNAEPAPAAQPSTEPAASK